MEKARDAASQAVEKAKDVASSVGSTVSHAASSVGSTVSSAASAVGHKADDLTSSAGTSIKNLGETLRQKAPHEGFLGSASQSVANSLESSGRYIEEAGLSGMMEDVTNLIRRNPFPAILVALGVGVLIGRALRR
jgi:ElaB/YqjD/DUF883 family membrane-anchored ribosome-binding protein